MKIAQSPWPNGAQLETWKLPFAKMITIPPFLFLEIFSQALIGHRSDIGYSGTGSAPKCSHSLSHFQHPFPLTDFHLVNRFRFHTTSCSPRNLEGIPAAEALARRGSGCKARVKWTNRVINGWELTDWQKLPAAWAWCPSRVSDGQPRYGRLYSAGSGCCQGLTFWVKSHLFLHSFFIFSFLY